MFLCLQAAYVEVWVGLDVATFDYMTLSSNANVPAYTLPFQQMSLITCFLVVKNEQSPDALASGLWNGEFGGDLLSHG